MAPAERGVGLHPGGLELGDQRVIDRQLGERNDAASEAMRGSEHAVVRDPVNAAGRGQRGEPAQQKIAMAKDAKVELSDAVAKATAKSAGRAIGVELGTTPTCSMSELSKHDDPPSFVLTR